MPVGLLGFPYLVAFFISDVWAWLRYGQGWFPVSDPRPLRRRLGILTACSAAALPAALLAAGLLGYGPWWLWIVPTALIAPWLILAVATLNRHRQCHLVRSRDGRLLYEFRFKSLLDLGADQEMLEIQPACAGRRAAHLANACENFLKGMALLEACEGHLRLAVRMPRRCIPAHLRPSAGRSKWCALRIEFPLGEDPTFEVEGMLELEPGTLEPANPLSAAGLPESGCTVERGGFRLQAIGGPATPR